MIDQQLLNSLSNSINIKSTLEQTPQLYRPIVTQTDADSKYLMRYFARQVNDKSFIVEIDKSQYKLLRNNPRFVTTQIKWKIIGKLETVKLSNGINLNGVKDQNKITVSEADLTFGGLMNYITDYGEFWLREN